MYLNYFHTHESPDDNVFTSPTSSKQLVIGLAEYI